MKVIFRLRAAGIRGLVVHNVTQQQEIILSTRVLLLPVTGTHIIKMMDLRDVKDAIQGDKTLIMSLNKNTCFNINYLYTMNEIAG